MKPDDVLAGDGRTSTPNAVRLSLRNAPVGFPYQVEVSVSPVTKIIACTWWDKNGGPQARPAVELTVEYKERATDTVTVTTVDAAKEVAKQWLTHAADAHRFAQDTLGELRAL